MRDIVKQHRSVTGCWILFLASGLMLAVAAAAIAQEEEPKAPAAKAKPAHKAAPTEKAAGKSAAAPEVPLPEDPAVQAVLESKPATPAECSRAAKILATLQRPDLAKILLKKVLDANPTEQQLAALADQFGATMFLDLASQPDLCPEAKQLADAVVAANNRQLQDPKRLATLIKQLQDPAEDVRAQAVAGLQDARAAGVEALVGALAGGDEASRTALVEMGSAAAGPMLAVLAGAKAEMKVQAIQVLNRLRAPEATPFLLGPAAAAGSDPRVRAAANAVLTRLLGRTPSKAQAVQILLKQAADYLQQRQPIRGEVDGRVALWHWDEEKSQCSAASYAVPDASRVLAARLARRLRYRARESPGPAALPGDDAGRGGRPSRAGQRHRCGEGPGRPRSPPPRRRRLERRLGICLGEPVAGWGHRSGASARPVCQGPGRPPHRRRSGGRWCKRPATRTAASAWRPWRQSWRCNRPPRWPAPAGCWNRSVSSPPAAAPAGPWSPAPTSPPCGNWGNSSAPLGYQTDRAVGGREALRMALASPDYEVAFIDSTIDDPPAALLLQQLRHDCRTAGLRVGLLARRGSFSQAQHVAGEDPLCMAFSRPHDQESLNWQLAQLATLGARQFVGFQERQSQAVRAMRLLAVLAASSGKLYDLHRAQETVLTALYMPALSAPACEVLTHLGTPEAQRALVELASRPTQPIAARNAAATAFRLNAEKFGILLSAAEVHRQYNRYQQSGDQDAATQRVLSSILDSIEAPTQPLKAKRPPPPRKASQ